VNTLSSDNKTEREVEQKQAGLSFLIVNLGVPWALRPNSPVLLQSCPKRVLFFFCRRELPRLLPEVSTVPGAGVDSGGVMHFFRMRSRCQEKFLTSAKFLM